MLKWFFLLVALLFFGLGLLTFFRAPNLLTWKLAILAGEFGQWLVVMPIALLILARLLPFSAKGQSFYLWVALAACAAVVALLSPVIRAYWIARTLPEEIQAAFPGRAMKNNVLSFSRLWKLGPPMAVPCTTYTYAETAGGAMQMNFYPAVSAKPRSPCVLVIHGGGWDSGDRSELPAFNQTLAAMGYAVAIIDYRLAPKSVWPAPREDALAAIKYLKAHADELNLDPQRFVLFGRSAGGQIAVSTAYAAHDPAIRGVISFYGPHDLLFAWKYGREDDVLNSLLLQKQYLGGTPESVPEQFQSASGIFHITADCPPTLLVHGALDTLVWNQQSIRLNAQLAQAGVPHYFLSLPWGVHAFEFNVNGPGGQLAFYALNVFLGDVFKEPNKDKG